MGILKWAAEHPEIMLISIVGISIVIACILFYRNRWHGDPDG